METMILASSSPRRSQLLATLGIPFTAVPSGYEEEFDSSPPIRQVERLAEMKVRSLLQERPDLSGRAILGADTCIDLNGRILGKPADRREAGRYLEAMSGTSHRVLTGISLWNGRQKSIITRTESTIIHVTTLSAAEIEWYLDTGEWEGAAGGYRIQGKGSLFVERIEGCFFNVMGLPIHLFYGMLQSQGYSLL